MTKNDIQRFNVAYIRMREEDFFVCFAKKLYLCTRFKKTRWKNLAACNHLKKC